jgi:hypothetical protein
VWRHQVDEFDLLATIVLSSDGEAMTIEFTAIEIETLIESMEYSKRNVRDAQGTPYAVRQENLALLDFVQAKLREARRASQE